MKIQQIFANYDFRDNDGVQTIDFCPICGTKSHPYLESGRKRPKCPLCGFVYFKNPAPGVSVLIIQDNCVLLGKRASGSSAAGKWCIPCGFIEYNEDFLSAAIREVKEETGLTVALQSIINVNSNFFAENLHTLVIVFLAKVICGKLSAGDDLDAVQWFNLKNPLPEMAFIADQNIIERFSVQKIDGSPIDTAFLNNSEPDS